MSHRPAFVDASNTLHVVEHFKDEDDREFFVELSIKDRKDLPAAPNEKLRHATEDFSRQAAAILADVRS